jgi:hypothetical protein
VKYKSIPLPLELAMTWRKAAMVHTNYERNNVLAMREVAAAQREACNGERNNAPTLKMEKWNGDATMLWVVGKWGNNSPEFTTAGRPISHVEPVARAPIQSA